MNIDITIVADQEAFLVDAPTPQASPRRWIQAESVVVSGPLGPELEPVEELLRFGRQVRALARSVRCVGAALTRPGGAPPCDVTERR